MPPRLRRVDRWAPGIRRRRRGGGFSYVDEAGDRIDDPEVLRRIAELAIPPGIDPRVLDAYDAGLTIGPALERVAAEVEPGDLPIHQPELERAVLDLICERQPSAAVERIAA